MSARTVCASATWPDRVTVRYRKQLRRLLLLSDVVVMSTRGNPLLSATTKDLCPCRDRVELNAVSLCPVDQSLQALMNLRVNLSLDTRARCEQKNRRKDPILRHVSVHD